MTGMTDINYDGVKIIYARYLGHPHATIYFSTVHIVPEERAMFTQVNTNTEHIDFITYFMPIFPNFMSYLY